MIESLNVYICLSIDICWADSTNSHLAHLLILKNITYKFLIKLNSEKKYISNIKHQFSNSQETDSVHEYICHDGSMASSFQRRTSTFYFVLNLHVSRGHLGDKFSLRTENRHARIRKIKSSKYFMPKIIIMHVGSGR